MSSVFVHAYEHADRTHVQVTGIAPGMRYSVTIARVSMPRCGPHSLDELARLAAYVILRETPDGVPLELWESGEVDGHA